MWGRRRCENKRLRNSLLSSRNREPCSFESLQIATMYWFQAFFYPALVEVPKSGNESRPDRADEFLISTREVHAAEARIIGNRRKGFRVPLWGMSYRIFGMHGLLPQKHMRST